MYSAQSPIQSWKEFQIVAQDFLETGEGHLLISRDFKERAKITLLAMKQFPDLDLIQLCSLGLFRKGELGIRELHFKISELITRSRLIDLLMRGLWTVPIKRLQKLNARHKSMQDRRRAVILMLRDFAALGTIIPHYVEPRNTTMIFSRTFVRALLEFNTKGELSLERSIFALARTANFKCARISK